MNKQRSERSGKYRQRRLEKQLTPIPDKEMILSIFYVNVLNWDNRLTFCSFLFVSWLSELWFSDRELHISCLISFNLSFASFQIAHKWLPWLHREQFSQNNTLLHSGANERQGLQDTSQSGARNKLLLSAHCSQDFNMRLGIGWLPKWHFSKLTAICQSAMLNPIRSVCAILLAHELDFLNIAMPISSWNSCPRHKLDQNFMKTTKKSIP